MATALAILTTLVGYNVAVKVYTLIKILGLRVDNYSVSDFEELLKDPRFRKYLR